MISQEFRQKFKRDLGDNFQYSSKVRQKLEAAKIYTNRGKVAHIKTINNVFQGYQDNLAIELMIMELYEEEIAKKKKLEKLRNKYSTASEDF
ncbi:hypothetical protein [Winogradskyella sp.]|uniref:hypothetical protein n=1 Tax=Winogradskyella sp. TaxID=1883156 RepID=UPI00260C58EB|nr:hypothetical protein [Winogradskyella sp.]